MSGYYLMARGWLDHPMLGGKREAFCRRAAWAWLIESAAFQPTKVSVGRHRVELKRGQLTYSVRFLAEAWGWDKAKVSRFISTIRECKAIECITETGQMLITICNYDQYQVPPRPTETPSETDARQDRDTSETNKNEGNEVDSSLRSESPATPAAKAEKSPGGRQLPKDWALTPERRLLAEQARETHDLDPVNLDLIADQFAHYWWSTPGPKGRKSDWDATWRGWVLRQDAKPRGGNGSGYRGQEQRGGMLGAAADLLGVPQDYGSTRVR